MSSRRLHNTIENPILELKIVSASDINHIDATDKVDVYAVVSLDGHTSQKKQSAKTPIDYEGGSNPTWNHTVKFSVNEREAKEDLLTVKVKLYSYWLEDENDLYMGEVNVSVHELLASNPLQPFVNGNVNKMKSLTYPLKLVRESKPNAKLSLSYRFKPVPVNDQYPLPSAPEYLPPFGQPIYTNPDPARSGQPIMYSPQFQTTDQTTTATKRALELVIKSAKDIRNVNVFNDMDVYAWVLICEGKKTIKKTKTPIAYSGFISPTWNHTVKFSFDEEELARKDRFTLVVELMSHRRAMGDKHIGEVKVPIQELIGSNAPSPLSDVDAHGMKLVTHKVTVPNVPNGVKGTLSFSYRFLKEQIMTPTPQPYIVYIPVLHQSHGSADPVHETSGYMTVQQGANAGTSNGPMPLYVPPPYQPHGYQQYSQPQLPSQSPQPQEQLHQFSLDSQSQVYQSHGYHPNSPPQPQLQPQPIHARPQVKPQGGSMAALGLGAAVMGRIIGGALMSEMMSDEVNIYEVDA